MSIELWPERDFDEELEYISYVGFIYLSVRSDYVEGAKGNEVAYIEGIYVRCAFKRLGFASIRIEQTETWARQKELDEIGSDTEIENRSFTHQWKIVEVEPEKLKKCK